jgi:hypothetical protein
LARDISAPRYRTLPNRAQSLVLISGCVLAAAVGPIVANSPSLAYGLAAILLLVTALSRTATRPIGSILIVAVITASALIDLPQHIRTGPTSGQGAESFALAALVVFLCLNGYVRAEIPDVRRLWPLPLFLGWAVISFSWGHLTQQGVQNVLVYTCFVGMVFVGATLGRAKPLHTYHVLNRGFQFAAAVGMGLYAVSFLIAGHGNRLVVSPRPFGLFGVLVVSWFMAAHVNGVRYAKYVVMAAVLLTLLSLSRSALAAQFAVIVLAQLATTRDLPQHGADARSGGGGGHHRAGSGHPVRPAEPAILRRRHQADRRNIAQRDRARRALVRKLGVVQGAPGDRLGCRVV